MKRLYTALLSMILGLGTLSAEEAIIVANPGEWTALADGHELIAKEINSEIGTQLGTAALQNSIAAEFTKIHHWEEQYDSYLRTAEGFASTLKSCTTLYNKGLSIFMSLCELRKAIRSNPQGVIATIGMNNLYMETAAEMTAVYSILKNAVAEGGDNNLLTGAQRNEMLWMLNDRLAEFHKKLKRLVMSVKSYTMLDLWHNATAGKVLFSNGDIAKLAKRRWKTRAKTVVR